MLNMYELCMRSYVSKRFDEVICMMWQFRALEREKWIVRNTSLRPSESYHQFNQEKVIHFDISSKKILYKSLITLRAYEISHSSWNYSITSSKFKTHRLWSVISWNLNLSHRIRSSSRLWYLISELSSISDLHYLIIHYSSIIKFAHTTRSFKKISIR